MSSCLNRNRYKMCIFTQTDVLSIRKHNKGSFVMKKSFNMIVLKKISIYAKTEVFTITKGLITMKKKKKVNFKSACVSYPIINCPF